MASFTRTAVHRLEPLAHSEVGRLPGRSSASAHPFLAPPGTGEAGVERAERRRPLGSGFGRSRPRGWGHESDRSSGCGHDVSIEGSRHRIRGSRIRPPRRDPSRTGRRPDSSRAAHGHDRSVPNARPLRRHRRGNVQTCMRASGNDAGSEGHVGIARKHHRLACAPSQRVAAGAALRLQPR
jgi:hypothetical protein